MIIIGVDPGLSGAIAALRFTSRCVAMYDMPVEWVQRSNGQGSKPARRLQYDIRKISLLLEEELLFGHPALVVIEKQAAYRGVSAARLGGLCEGAFWGIAQSLGAKVLRVRPQEWKKHWRLIKKDKLSSLKVALHYFPGVGIKKSAKQDQAEALLIAGYGHHWMSQTMAAGEIWQKSEDLS